MFILHYILGFSSFVGLWRTTVSTRSSSPTSEELRVHTDYDSSTADCAHHPARVNPQIPTDRCFFINVRSRHLADLRAVCRSRSRSRRRRRRRRRRGVSVVIATLTGWGRCCSCGLQINNTTHLSADNTHGHTNTHGIMYLSERDDIIVPHSVSMGILRPRSRHRLVKAIPACLTHTPLDCG